MPSIDRNIARNISIVARDITTQAPCRWKSYISSESWEVSKEAQEVLAGLLACGALAQPRCSYLSESFLSGDHNLCNVQGQWDCMEAWISG